MIKIEKGNIQIEGFGIFLKAELACLLLHFIRDEEDKDMLKVALKDLKNLHPELFANLKSMVQELDDNQYQPRHAKVEKDDLS